VIHPDIRIRLGRDRVDQIARDAATARAHNTAPASRGLRLADRRVWALARTRWLRAAARRPVPGHRTDGRLDAHDRGLRESPWDLTRSVQGREMISRSEPLNDGCSRRSA
jgi:hypothetical protein